ASAYSKSSNKEEMNIRSNSIIIPSLGGNPSLVIPASVVIPAQAGIHLSSFPLLSSFPRKRESRFLDP
ncbi:MAG: hypothetical protein KKH06_02610, partial [Gammaproteobacteria bacterium]|nr:hypothetical protein [Gammaproteobacteria bacterium]